MCFAGNSSGTLGAVARYCDIVSTSVKRFGSEVYARTTE